MQMLIRVVMAAFGRARGKLIHTWAMLLAMGDWFIRMPRASQGKDVVSDTSAGRLHHLQSMVACSSRACSPRLVDLLHSAHPRSIAGCGDRCRQLLGVLRVSSPVSIRLGLVIQVVIPAPRLG